MDIDHKLGFVFTDVLLEVISTSAGCSFEVLSQETDYDFETVTGVMNLNGEKGVMLFVTANEPDMRELCSCMTGVSKDDVTAADIEDALCEIVNMAAGGAKLRLSDTDYSFMISQPFIIRGDNITVLTKKRTHIISRTLGNGEISIKLKLIF